MEDDKSKEKKVPVEMILEVKPEQKPKKELEQEKELEQRSKKGSERPPDIFKPYGEEMKLEGKSGQRPEEQQPRDRERKPRRYDFKNKDSKDARDLTQDAGNLTQKEIKSARDAALKKIEEERKKRFDERQKMMQKKLSEASKEELKKVKKRIDEKLKKKAATEEGLAKKRAMSAAMKLAKKFQIDAKQGTSLSITAMFFIVLGIALVNDLSDIVLEIVGAVVSLTGVGLAVLAAFEYIIKIVDIATTAILVLFTIYVGGETRANSKQKFMMLARILIAFGIEAIPFVGMITSWTITTLWNWYDIRRRANEAEEIEQKIMEGG